MFGYIDFLENKPIVTDMRIIVSELPNVDENLVFAISELNRLGYITENCCEGHYEKHFDGTELVDAPYIAFVNGITLSSVPKGWNRDIDTEDDFGKEIHSESIIYNGMNYADTPLKAYKEKMQALSNLYEWIESLEIYK